MLAILPVEASRLGGGSVQSSFFGATGEECLVGWAGTWSGPAGRAPGGRANFGRSPERATSEVETQPLTHPPRPVLDLQPQLPITRPSCSAHSAPCPARRSRVCRRPRSSAPPFSTAPCPVSQQPAASLWPSSRADHTRWWTGLVQIRTATKRGGGSSKNGRNSIGKRLGVKKYGG